MQWLKSVLAAFWLLACVGAAQAGTPAEVSAADARQVRAVIQAQLDAFAVDDAKRAFSFAAPNVRQRFGTAENFLAMVRAGYPVVHRPASVAFLKPAVIDGQVVQGVQMTDASGLAWLATYAMERQPDKSWRIAGCAVVRSEGRFV